MQYYLLRYICLRLQGASRADRRLHSCLSDTRTKQSQADESSRPSPRGDKHDNTGLSQSSEWDKQHSKQPGRSRQVASDTERSEAISSQEPLGHRRHSPQMNHASDNQRSLLAEVRA